jgi:hypothetical protein
MKNKARRLEEGPRDGLTPPPKPMANTRVAKRDTFRLESKEAI